MLEKSFKSRDKLTLSNANYHSLDLNRSITNSVMTSSYIVLKDGTKKKKRNINSYMEEFLERRRMAAEFAQAKRSTSTKNYRVKLKDDEKNNKDSEFNVQFNIKKIEETININNLKNNLPGKTTELINNNDVIGNDLSKYLNPPNQPNNEGNNINKNICLQRQNNFNVIQNKYNNFKRHNIVYTKKTNLSQNLGKNNNLSNHSFTENRYSTNHDNEEQCNILNTNITNENENKNIIDDIFPIKQNHITLNAKGGIEFTENRSNENEEKIIFEDKNEENKNNNNLNNGEHFLTIMEKMIKNVNANMNKSQPSPNISKEDSNIFNKVSASQNNNFSKYKEYQKFLNKNDKSDISNLNQNIIVNKDNNTDDENDLDIKNEINMNEKITNQEIFSIKKEILDLNKDENPLKNLTKKNDIINNNNKESNTNKKISEEYIVEENEEKNINKINNEKEENQNENEEIEQEKSINRQNEENEEQEEEEINNINSNNNEEEEENEDAERCEVLKGDGDKSKYLKRKNNIITEEIEEVEEGMDNENTSEFPTNKTGRNKNSNRNMNGLIQEEKNSFENKNIFLNNKENIIISSENKKNEISEEQNEQILSNKTNQEKEEDKNNIEIIKDQKEKDESLKIIKEEKKYNNLNKIEIKDLKKDKKLNQKNTANKNYSFVYSNTSKTNQINNEKNNITNNTLENNNTFESNENNNNIVNISNSNNNEKETDLNNEDFNLNKISDINNINSEINDIDESPNKINFFNYERNTKEKEDFIRVINKDIERLEKIRNNNFNTKEDESYINEIDNFINIMREKRKSVNNDIINNIDMSYLNRKDYIPPKNILELKKIYKNLNNKNNNINIETNYNNILQKINYNKMKLPISKSSSLQSLLNEIKKEKTYNININNININNENQIINNNFFTEKINKDINDSINNINNLNNNSEEAKNSEDNARTNFKLFDETKFRKIKETNLRKRNIFRNEFKFKDYVTNNNLSHIYLDKVKEDLLMNISILKPLNKRELKNKWNINKITFSNNSDITDLDNSEIMPANSMKSLYFNKF